jgi:energy-coupling factor transport system ATP-binding protein
MPAFFALEQMAFTYPQAGLGLEPVSLEVQRGEGILIAGPSGCGKSTLARCMTGLIPHLYRGELHGQGWLDGDLTEKTPLWQLSEKAGLVFQNPAAQLLAPSVEEEIIFGLENLGLSAEEVRRRCDDALERFGLTEMRSRVPQTLSGGEQQKLALACMLARGTPALVLDEPLSMLDTTAARELVCHVDDLIRQGTTVVFFEHRQEYLRAIPDLRTMVLGCKPDLTGLEGASQKLAAAGDEAPVAGRDHPTAPFRLEISDLEVERGGRTVLSGLNLSLEGGQIVTLVGRNGSGKTTLLRTIAGLQPYRGRLGVKAQDGQARHAFGLVFQNPDLQLFNPSVREEILYRVEKPDLELYEWLLDALGLRSYEHTPPLLLSEGEKRRVALATVLMRRPQYGILLDEPSLGLDTRHKEVLLRTLRALAQAGYLVIMATHEVDLAFQAERVILLSPKGVQADGPAAQVLVTPEAWERIGLWLPDWAAQAA